MNIVFEHQAVLPVEKYGGTERIIFWLMKELVRRGNRVSFIGPPESRVEEFGIRLIPHTEGDWRGKIPEDTELVHLFATPPREIEYPYLVTIEGNGQVGETFDCNTVFISQKHAQNHGGECFVYNGIDLDEYPFTPHQRAWDQFLFLAKGSWKVKNLKDCVRVCRQAKKSLDIAGGKVFNLSRRVRSHGMVGQDKKIPLLQQSDALLFPVRWHEPFGISMIEAFAMGVPVIGSPYGSLPEIIQPEVGVICKDFEDLLSVVKEDRQFDSGRIREYVGSRFGISTIAEQYLKLYEKVIDGEALNAQPPKTLSTQDPQTLLPF